MIHQYNGYRSFCLPTTDVAPREWCSNTIPQIYTFVQGRYWNVGFLRYWRIEQIPNFILGAPPLLVLGSAAVGSIRAAFPSIRRSLFTSSSGTTEERWTKDDEQAITMFPHALHALAMTLILLFASHTQIALRVAPTLPFFHWSVARLFLSDSKAARSWWIGWLVIWWPLSCVLWGAFLPPA